MAAILTRFPKAFALAVVVLCTAGMALAQDEPAEASPLSIQPGTFITVRINEAITSDRNQVGDVFSATLTQPMIVQGIIVAQRGQTVGGRVVEAKKAGMVSGVSRLGIELTRLTLADGQNVRIRTQLLVRNGRAQLGRDAGAIVGTTGAGAVIGGIAGRGQGAAIGAGVGAAAGTLGVLLSRGHSTTVYPESMLTFEVLDPVPIDTSNAPQAFRAVNAEDYQQSRLEYRPRPRQEIVDPEDAPPAVYPYPYLYGPAYGPYPYYARPYYYGPSVSFLFGGYYGYPRFYGYRPYYSSYRYYGYRPYFYGYRPRYDGYRPHSVYVPRHSPGPYRHIPNNGHGNIGRGNGGFGNRGGGHSGQEHGRR